MHIITSAPGRLIFFLLLFDILHLLFCNGFTIVRGWCVAHTKAALLSLYLLSCLSCCYCCDISVFPILLFRSRWFSVSKQFVVLLNSLLMQVINPFYYWHAYIFLFVISLPLSSLPLSLNIVKNWKLSFFFISLCCSYYSLCFRN